MIKRFTYLSNSDRKRLRYSGVDTAIINKCLKSHYTNGAHIISILEYVRQRKECE